MQKAMGVEAFYTLEFITERYEKFSEEEKIKTIIHELMHIPQTFGGGFRQHDHVCEKNVNQCYRSYKEKKKNMEENDTLGIQELHWKNQDNLKKLNEMRKNAEKSFFHF